MLNWGALRAFLRPYFFLSFILGSLVTKPAFFNSDFKFSSDLIKALVIPCLIAPAWPVKPPPCTLQITSNLSTVKTTSKKTYSYDENGNNIKEVDSIKNITKEMTYDVDNRLDTYTQTENNKTTTQSNLYNGDGQRI